MTQDDNAPLTARGSFTVEVTQRPPDPDTDPLGQLRLKKTWTGDIEGTGHGLMLSGGDPSAGTAGYVAMEVVSGTLAGQWGTLAFQQYGAMRAGEAELVYEVVPGSGTGELAGLSGVLTLDVVDGAHQWELRYRLG